MGVPVSGVRAHHLRSKECWSAVTPLQVLIPTDDDLAAAKVTQSHIAPSAHQHILRLQVAVHHLVVMQVVQRLQADWSQLNLYAHSFIFYEQRVEETRV